MNDILLYSIGGVMLIAIIILLINNVNLREQVTEFKEDRLHSLIDTDYIDETTLPHQIYFELESGEIAWNVKATPEVDFEGFITGQNFTVRRKVDGLFQDVPVKIKFIGDKKLLLPTR